MGDAYITRRGGGAPLNFKVVGGTKPSNPKENTIWVDTDTAITDWVFSATQPAAVSGRVWIQTGTTSPVTFNALKKNSIQVCPLTAKQYVNGAWVDKAAKSYQGGAWVEFDPNRYIFKQGIGSDSAFIHKPWNKYVSDVTTERIYCNAPATTESDGASGFAGAYDFTNYSKLVFDVLSNNSNFSCGYLNSVLDGPKPTLIGSVTPATGSRKTISIDISAVSGNKYIAFKISSGGAGSVEIYNIYLEP